MAKHRKKLSFLKSHSFLLFVFAMFSVSISCGQHPVKDEPGQRTDLNEAERLLVLIDFEQLKVDVFAELKVPKKDRVLFLSYLKTKFKSEVHEFIAKANKGIINEGNLKAFAESVKQKYTIAYQSYQMEKKDFAVSLDLNRTSESTNILGAGEPCTNMDFEEGTPNGWSGAVGVASTNPFPDNIDEGFDNERHEIVTVGDTDPNIPMLPVVAPGGNYSLRLGNTVDGGDASVLRQTFMVSETNNVFTYKYACVLEDPGDHLDEERPYFKVRLYDQSGNEINCGTYTAMAKPPIENFEYYPVPEPGRRNRWLDLYFRDWTTVSIPLLDYVGQNVTIEFVVSDCERSGHLGYAYIDGECLSLGDISYGTICNNEEVSFTAPEGFKSYEWSGPGIIGSSNSRTIKANIPGNYSVELVPIADNPCPETLSFDALEYCEGENQKVNLCEDERGSSTVDGVNLREYDTLMLGDNPTASVLSWHSAIPVNSGNKLTSNVVRVTSGDVFYALVHISQYYVDTLALSFTVNSLPVVNFPAIDNLCMGEPDAQITTVTPAGGVFSGPYITGSGIFSPVKAGTFYLQYKVTNFFGCTDSSNQKIKVVEPVFADAGPDAEICESSYTLMGNSDSVANGLWSVAGGDGKLTDATESQSSVFGLSNGINKFVWSLELPGCPVSNDTVEVWKFASLTTPDAGPDDTVCVNTGSFNLSGNVPDNSNGESVEWKSLGPLELTSPNTPGTSLQNLVPGTYQLVYSIIHDVCPDKSDTVQINIDEEVAQPVASSIMTCDKAVQISASSLTPATATGKWVITEGQGVVDIDTSPSTTLLDLTNPDTTYLTWEVRNGVCPPKKVDITVGKPGPVTSPEIIFRGVEYTNDTVTLCLKDSGDLDLKATSPGDRETALWTHVSGNSVSIPGGSFSSQTMTLQNSSVSTFRYTIESTISANCPTEEALVTIKVNNIPEMPGPISGSNNICVPANEEVFSIPFTSGATKHHWSVPAGTSLTYVSDTVIRVDFSKDAANGTIEVTAENSCGINGPATLPVSITPRVAVHVNLSGPDSVCYGSPIDRFVAFPSNPGNTPVYTWELDNIQQTGTQNTYSFTSLDPGIYSVRVIMQSSEKCTIPENGKAEDETTLVIVPRPEITVSVKDPSECEGNGVINLTGLDPYKDYELYYQDSDYRGPLNIQANEYGQYLLPLPDGIYSDIQVVRLGCPGNVVSAEINNPLIVPDISLHPEDTTICEGETVTFFTKESNGGEVPGYQWYLNGNPINVSGPVYASDTIKNGDMLTVKLTSSSACASPATVESNPVRVTVVQFPDALVNGSSTFCKGDKLNFIASGGQYGSIYQWYYNGTLIPGANRPVYTSNRPGFYSVEVSNGSCKKLSSPLEAMEIEVIVDAGQDQEIKISDYKDETITAYLKGSSNGVSPYWSPDPRLDDPNKLSTLATLPAGYYTFTLNDSIDKCNATDVINIRVKTSIWIPTAISPNGDGANEKWFIKGLEGYDEYRINVYNRYGSIIHTQENSYKPWDGYRNGQPVPVGTYYFVVSVPDDKVYTGNLTIIR